ncbi:hypothetical protein A1D31_38625 [Bradyrhizobium liaoningense]|nr:hypothetical protein A1D31_38625 [Bradyrhizobium liaoningense]
MGRKADLRSNDECSPGILVTAACSGRHNLIGTLRAELQQRDGLGSALAPLFDTILDPSDKRDDIIGVIASLLGRMLRPDFVFDAG